MKITLPYPPTINTYHRHVVIGGKPRTLISKRGRAYETAAVLIARTQRPAKPLDGDVRLTIEVHPPDKRERDISNIVKVLEDCLTKAGWWVDDSQVAELHVVRRDRVRGGRVVVTVEAM